jgi:hypothetical protein
MVTIQIEVQKIFCTQSYIRNSELKKLFSRNQRKEYLNKLKKPEIEKICIRSVTGSL